jgi:hypothetical protein
MADEAQEKNKYALNGLAEMSKFLPGSGERPA